MHSSWRAPVWLVYGSQHNSLFLITLTTHALHFKIVSHQYYSSKESNPPTCAAQRDKFHIELQSGQWWCVRTVCACLFRLQTRPHLPQTKPARVPPLMPRPSFSFCLGTWEKCLLHQPSRDVIGWSYDHQFYVFQLCFWECCREG